MAAKEYVPATPISHLFALRTLRTSPKQEGASDTRNAQGEPFAFEYERVQGAVEFDEENTKPTSQLTSQNSVLLL